MPVVPGHTDDEPEARNGHLTVKKERAEEKDRMMKKEKTDRLKEGEKRTTMRCGKK